MRIGFMLYGDLSIRTGGFLYDRELVNGLRSTGASVEVLELPWRSYAAGLLQPQYRQALEWCDNGNFDVLIQDELAHPSLVRLNRVLHERHALPVITLVHHMRSSESHPAVLRWIYREVERAYFACVDGAIVNSEATCDAVRPLLTRATPVHIAMPGRGHLLPGLGEDEIRERSSRAGPLQVLYLGSVIPRKGLIDLVFALGAVDIPEIHLTVIGREDASPRYVRQVKDAITRQGMDARTRWLGEVGDDALSDVLANAHILVVPSSHEGFGIAYLDAMAYGVVPVGTTEGGAGSIITPGENGFLLSPSDGIALAACLYLLAQNRELLGQIGVQAYRDYQRHPTWKQITEGVYEFLNTEFLGDRARHQAA